MSQRPDNDLFTPINHVVGTITNTAGSVGRTFFRTALSLQRMALPRARQESTPGATPGIDLDELAKLPDTGERVSLEVIDYSADRVEVRRIDNAEKFLNPNREEWVQVRWLNVDSLDDVKLIRTLAGKYKLHPLAVEDMLHVPQRAKAEPFAGDGRFSARLFVVTQMFRIVEDHLVTEQVSIFLGHNTILTFQQRAGDVWDPIRQRIQKPESKLRRGDASFLLHALLDAITDHAFPILERFGDRLEIIELSLLDTKKQPELSVVRELHEIKRELLLLRRQLWPMREMIGSLQREPHEVLSEQTQTYMRDVHDHAIQAMDLLETYREVANALVEAYMTSVSNHMNQVMKVLTLIATIFIPLTFIAGIYGMNFEHMPELHWKWSYPIVWGVFVTLPLGMFAWFRYKRWL